MIIGTTPKYEKGCVVWRKISEHAQRSLPSYWVMLPLETYNPYYLPKMSFVALAYFNERILAFGCDKVVYVSRDQGITWKTDSRYAFPVDFDGNTFKVAVDDEGVLWLMDTESGRTWRSYLVE